MNNKGKKANAAAIVAHPDDETLWGGGTILMHPQYEWTITTLCRASDSERASKFTQAVKKYSAVGQMADMNDGPEQLPLSKTDVEETVLSLISKFKFDLVITHSPFGEYTRHRRHEETGRAVLQLWQEGRLSTVEMWFFAYEDGNNSYLPRPIDSAHKILELPEDIWQQKYRIITEVYGFESDSFEARLAGRKEAFWCFKSADQANEHFFCGGLKNESAGVV